MRLASSTDEAVPLTLYIRVVFPQDLLPINVPSLQITSAKKLMNSATMKENINEVKPPCIPNMPVIISLRRQPLRDAKRFDEITLLNSGHFQAHPWMSFGMHGSYLSAAPYRAGCSSSSASIEIIWLTLNQPKLLRQSTEPDRQENEEYQHRYLRHCGDVLLQRLQGRLISLDAGSDTENVSSSN